MYYYFMRHLIFFITFYTLVLNNVVFANIITSFFKSADDIVITWNGISSTSIQQYNRYCIGICPAMKQQLKDSLEKSSDHYDDNEIRCVKNKYELIRNLLSFSFFSRKCFSRKYFYFLGFSFLDNTHLWQWERLRVQYNLENYGYKPGVGYLGIFSFSFGCGFYWFKNIETSVSSAFSLGFVWTRDNAMLLPNYKQQCGENVNKKCYYGCAKPLYDFEKDDTKCENLILCGYGGALEFLPLHAMTWKHGDILFKIDIVSITYNSFYIALTWKRGLLDTIDVIKYKWWKCLPSTMSVEIGIIFKNYDTSS